jgi:tetratricopeptide (TPR) repeat protein
MIASIPFYLRRRTVPALLSLLLLAFCPAVRANDKEKKPEKEKKEKIEPWTEIRTAHFIVVSDGGEKTARRFANQFEILLRVFQLTLPKARTTNGLPIRLIVARDGQSFARVVPEFPFSKTREQPAGAFVTGPEKIYVAIRANAEGHFVFQDIYHEFARSVLRLSYHNLPPWIEEGYSSVYNNVTFNDRGARLERPEPDDMSTLFESPLLPLDLVLGADRESPYYSPGNKGSVYFAESRVLLHYLITDPTIASGNALERYLTAVTGGMDYLPAARSAFGDLNQLQDKLEAYIKLVNGPPYEFPINGAGDSGGPPRLLSAAESEARLADFLSLRGRDSDAEDKLEEALTNEPAMAEAEQNLGFLELKKENVADAEKHLEHASQLDPKDGLNFYGLGLLAVEKAGHDQAAPGAIEAFEKSVALNPEFGPAWYNLATLYALRDQTLPKALNAAQKAAALVPGNAEYQLEVATVLDQMGRPEEARKTATQVKESATDRATIDKAGDLMARVSSSPKQPATVAAAPVAPKPVPAKPSDSMPKLERRTEPDPKPASTASAPTTSAPTPAPARTDPAPAPPPSSDTTSVYSRVYSMIGTVLEVNCGLAPQVQLTLKSLTISLKLHADNFDRLAIKVADGAAGPAKENACAGLRGRTARISYHLVSDKGWDGEIQDVELR